MASLSDRVYWIKGDIDLLDSTTHEFYSKLTNYLGKHLEFSSFLYG